MAGKTKPCWIQGKICVLPFISLINQWPFCQTGSSWHWGNSWDGWEWLWRDLGVFFPSFSLFLSSLAPSCGKLCLCSGSSSALSLPLVTAPQSWVIPTDPIPFVIPQVSRGNDCQAGSTGNGESRLALSYKSKLKWWWCLLGGE